MKLTDLPSDVLYTIFPYLTAAEYLKLTNCTKAFFPYREDPTFWHTLTRKTFRIPDQPLLQEARWQWLYKKLLTQTKLYTWGSNANGNLGHVEVEPADNAESLHARPHVAFRRSLRPQGRRRRLRRDSGWPREALIDERVGIVADVQCG